MVVAQHHFKNSELQPTSVTSKPKFVGVQGRKVMPLYCWYNLDKAASQNKIPHIMLYKILLPKKKKRRKKALCWMQQNILVRDLLPYVPKISGKSDLCSKELWVRLSALHHRIRQVFKELFKAKTERPHSRILSYGKPKCFIKTKCPFTLVIC